MVDRRILKTTLHDMGYGLYWVGKESAKTIVQRIPYATYRGLRAYVDWSGRLGRGFTEEDASKKETCGVSAFFGGSEGFFEGLPLAVISNEPVYYLVGVAIGSLVRSGHALYEFNKLKSAKQLMG